MTSWPSVALARHHLSHSRRRCARGQSPPDGGWKLLDSYLFVTMVRPVRSCRLTGALLRCEERPTTKWATATGRSSEPAKLGDLELLVWCTLAVLCVTGHSFITHGPLLGNDSYVYLSEAENFLAGRPASTSIVYFDTERSAGRIPAPVTTFPAGFSLATSAVTATGLPLEYSALAISISALALLIPVLTYAARLLGIGTFLTRALLAWLIGNSWVSIYATADTAESLFTLTSVAAITLLITGMIRARAGSPRLWPFLLGSLLIGLSYWVRYAGVFLFLSTAVLFAARSLIIRDKASRNATLTLGVAAAIIGAGFLRNELLTGNWKGGNGKEVHHAIVQVLHDFLVSVHHLLLGGIASARFSWLEGLFVAGSLATGIAITTRGGKAPLTGRLPWRDRLGPSALMIWYVAVYCAGMIYLGVTSVISFDTRMFYPILPVALLLLARLLQVGEPTSQSVLAARTAFCVGLASATTGYVCIHARSYFTTLGPAPHELVVRELGGAVSSGSSMQSWISATYWRRSHRSKPRPGQRVVAPHRKTLALVSQQYSNQVWDAAAIHSVMRTYDARFLILYSGEAADDVVHDSPFLSAGRTDRHHLVGSHWRRVAAVFSVFRLIT